MTPADDFQLREELATVINGSGYRELLHDGPAMRLAIVDAVLANPDVVLRALGGEQHGGRPDTHAEYVHFVISPKVAVWVFDTREAI